MVAMAFMNLALFETWQFVPNSSKENCGHSFVAGVIHYRGRFIIVENLYILFYISYVQRTQKQTNKTQVCI